MTNKPRVEGKPILINEGRIAFARIIEAAYRTDKFGREVKTKPDGSPQVPQYTMTWLLDPSNPVAAATIKEIKAEAKRLLDAFFPDGWPKDNAQTGTKGVIPCFGNGNDLKKVYDGYKDMFFIKCGTRAGKNTPAGNPYAAANDNSAPFIGALGGRWVKFLSDNAWHIVDRNTGQTTDEVVDPSQVPYSGAICRGRIKLYVYNNEQAGVNANFMGVQFLRKGEAFGGGRRTSADEELAQMAGDAPVAPATTEQDPW